MPPYLVPARRTPAISRLRLMTLMALFVAALLSTATPAAAASPAPTSGVVAVTGTNTPGPLLPTDVPGNVDSLNGGAASTPAPEPTVSEPKPQGPGLSPLGWVGVALLVLVSMIMTGVAFTTLAWMLHAWRTPEHLVATRFTRGPVEGTPARFSLLVPGRHEEEVMGDTLDQLAAIDYDDLEIIAIVGDDDPGTTEVAQAAARRHPGRVRVVVDSSVPKNKPKALNTALAHCTGDIVGVFDAEDEVHPRLITNVDARFRATGADIVQGGVQLMNVHTSWWSMRNCLEYYFWFRSRLHFHAGQRFIPLGGNTVFVRTPLLREVNGWDPECLAEDCEIGVRLSTRGAQVAVAYDPELVTREETPGTLPSLIKQRTRWNQGFLQVLRKGIWRELPTRRQRLLARYTLSMSFLQAFTGLMIPVSLALVLFAKVPTWVSLITFVPLVPTVVTLAVEAAGLHEFGRAYDVKVRLRDYVVLTLGTFPYQLLLAGAAVRAVVRERRGETGWEKTEHSGIHRVPRQAAATDAVVIDLRDDAREGALTPAGGTVHNAG